MIVRHLITGNAGEVDAEAVLAAGTVGDPAGLWYYVTWDNAPACWVQASSVEEVQ